MVSPSETLPDLLSRYATDGGETVFAELVRLGAPLVWGVAMRRLGDAQLAEEAAQNVFIILARKARVLAGRPGLTVWLHHTALLEAANLSRSRSRRENRLRRMAMDPVACGQTASSAAGCGSGFGWTSEFGQGGTGGFDFTESGFENGGDARPELNHGNVRTGCLQHSGKPETGSWLDEALDRLPAADRTLLLGRFYEKRGFRELAADLGKSEAALRKQAGRALAKLRARLQSRLGDRSVGQGAVAGLLAAGFSGAEVVAAVGTVVPGFSVSAPLPAAWAAKAVAAAVWSPAVAAPGTTGGWLAILTFMSTPKATFSAAVLLCLLLGTSAWLQLENSAQAAEISRLSRRSATVLTVRKSPPGRPGSVLTGREPAAPAVSPDEVPPSPLTGAALVKAWQRTQSDSLYDPGYTLSSIAAIWEAAPEEEWPRLLREADAASASALARSQTAAALLNGWSSRNPPWVCEELLRRKSEVLRYSVRKWASADREGAWRWIQEKTASGELPDKGIGGAASAAAGARRDFADSHASHRHDSAGASRSCGKGVTGRCGPA